MKSIDLKPWLIRMSEGDEEAFHVVYAATSEQAYRTIYFLHPVPADVDDIMSEAYMELHRSLPSYRLEQPFQPWFHGLLIRQVRSWKRKLWRRFRLIERVRTLPSDSPRQAMEERLGERLELLSLVETLSHKLKEIIVLRYYHDYSLETIAQLLNVPLGTVKSRHRLALNKLRSQMKPDHSNREESSYVH
ncbi:ECF RNA polymerase sigma factor SigW [Paenibacillus solanacearum]|uniref:ECF RNA polymerase sigma factor SigW n=1 Tax=Paenibacillus solanacearum TaxID=2048548 RepID=A0A916JZ15_9BACL|nr:sigma-70 family RNA polymerase sigma factor [Paenibacillus solanacearum]CAG7617361.1 ECF RNA polymerase sigma factor SigW [Paenibacillus solanacearum]